MLGFHFLDLFHQLMIGLDYSHRVGVLISTLWVVSGLRDLCRTSGHPGARRQPRLVGPQATSFAFAWE